MLSAWSELYDQVSGYPYYWNPNTNEVRWDKPPEFEYGQNIRLRKPVEANSDKEDVTHAYDKIPKD